MAKTYRTAGGKHIDLENLIAQNENVKAVGNMNVNAKGDVVDSSNKVTSTRSAQVNHSYRKQIGNVAKDLPVATSKKTVKKVEPKVEEEIVGLDNEPVVEEAPKPKTKKKTAKKKETPAGGLAAAIAKTREVKQEPKPTPREEERSTTGVKKI